MRLVKDSRGKSWGVEIKLAEVRRLKRGVPTDQDEVFQCDLDFLDQERLQGVIDQILQQPLFCAQLVWSLLPDSDRTAMTFDTFLERWEATELLNAAVEVASAVIDFFRGRVPIAPAMEKVLNLARKGIEEATLFCGTLTETQIEVGMLAEEWNLTAEQSKPLFDMLSAGASREEVLTKLMAISSGNTSGDSPASVTAPTSGDSASENSTGAPLEPGNSPPESVLPAPAASI